MKTKKYELLDEPGTGLKRLRALRSFSSVTAGDLGGLIEREENLGHEGCCWVSDNSQVFGDARVSGYAQVSDDSQVFGDAQVYGYARVFGRAQVYGYARVFGDEQPDDEPKRASE